MNFFWPKYTKIGATPGVRIGRLLHWCGTAIALSLGACDARTSAIADELRALEGRTVFCTTLDGRLDGFMTLQEVGSDYILVHIGDRNTLKRIIPFSAISSCTAGPAVAE